MTVQELEAQLLQQSQQPPAATGANHFQHVPQSLAGGPPASSQLPGYSSTPGPPNLSRQSAPGLQQSSYMSPYPQNLPRGEACQNLALVPSDKAFTAIEIYWEL